MSKAGSRNAVARKPAPSCRSIAEPTTKLANRYRTTARNVSFRNIGRKKSDHVNFGAGCQPRLMMPATGEVVLSANKFRGTAAERRKPRRRAKILSTRYPDNRRPAIVERPTRSSASPPLRRITLVRQERHCVYDQALGHGRTSKQGATISQKSAAARPPHSRSAAGLGSRRLRVLAAAGLLPWSARE